MGQAQRIKMPLLPGVYKDDTPTVAEAFAIDSSWVRFHRDKWQVCAGYEAASTLSFSGIVRGAYSWADNQGVKIAGFGTAAKLYALYGGDMLDITPLKSKGTLVDPFTTTNTSTTVLVVHANHGLKDTDTITFSNANAAGGITVNGAYVITLRNKDSYYITHGSPATSSVTGGGNVEYEAALDVGLVDGIGGLGYGTGTYGTGVYGVTTRGDINPRVWQIYNWGQNMLALPDNGALYEWQPQPTYPELVTNGDFALAAEWTAGAGWVIGSGVATASAGSASDLSQDMTGTLIGGYTYVLTFTATVSAGSFVFRVVSDPSGTPTDISMGEAVTKSATYTRRFTAPAAPTLIKFAKDAAFAGTLDDVSIKVVSTAYRLQDAPPYAIDMLVDPQDRVVLFGTVEYGAGQYNSMHIRWSDVGNNRTWDPSSTNGAGFETLRDGSEIRGAISLKNENLIWTDVALYYMRRNSSGYSVRPISGAGGLIAKRARAELDGTVFWWGTDQNFHIYQAGNPQIIGCSLRRDVMDNLSINQQAKIECGINPAYSEVYWLYPDARDGAGIECSRAVVYNWSSQCWYTHQMARTEWIKPGVFASPLGFGTDGIIYNHEYGSTFNGSALSWLMETGGYELGSGDVLWTIQNLIPDFEEQAGAISIKVSARNWAQDPWTVKATITSAVGQRDNWMRVVARQMKFRFSGNSAPAFARFGDIKMLGASTGSRK